MTRNLLKIVQIAFCIGLVLLTCTACENEDDIDEIFIGKTWYMNGGTISGKKLNSDIRNFYTDAGTNAYYITFSSQTFKGMLTNGDSFAGTWTADGKKQTLKLKMTETPTASTPFDKQIYHIIANATSYRSGADFLQLKKDGENVLLLGNKR
ncbi:MAG: DUF4847 family protein [Bacteroidaceae bacterium]|nr:DUF4847 family protein [Bacteroidaceae bacterium]